MWISFILYPYLCSELGNKTTILYLSKQQSKLLPRGAVDDLMHYCPRPKYCCILKYRSTSLSQSPRKWQKYFELSEVRHKQNVTSPQYDVHVQFFQDILLQYMCSKTVPTEKGIEMKTKEIHFSLFYFHFNYVVDRHNEG